VLSIVALYLGVGAFAGVLAGLLGVGGGVVIVPALVLSFDWLALDGSHLMQLAVGTSLTTIVATSMSSIRAHHRRGAVLWPVVRNIAPGIVLGVILGALIADSVSSEFLRLVIGVFVLISGTNMLLGGTPAAHRALPEGGGLLAAGGVIGTVSALVGIGGGALSVPFLAFCNTEMKKAVATSAAIGLPIAVTGSASFVLTGLNEVDLPAWSTGYLYWPGFAGIALASTLFAPLGARLAHSLPTTTLKRVFAVLLLVVGTRMLLG
jgi:hypothetical protein